MYHTDSKSSLTVEALKDPPKKKPTKAASGGLKGFRKKKDKKPETPNVNLMDFGKKALHCSWHPQTNCVAVAGLNKLYIYQAQ
jgi:serine/threonine-protein phosphatase 2A regulatory subunit B